ncbi:hypothetical protein QCA50_012549 [Cerrena zonata]|uniref:Uncharacterized protein n=1 Tax=Cerrena zonata TaxID=2478898 RepID=A0AAW0FSC5_9APHY
MTVEYEVWFRDPHLVFQNIFSNPGLKDEVDYACYHQFSVGGERRYQTFMSGNWAWRHSDIIIAEDASRVGCMLIPVIAGSDKTTVSIATGNNEYYPLYVSPGNVHNNVRRAHRDALVLVGVLAIPKTERRYQNDVWWRKFRRQLFHSSISAILQSLRPWMTTPFVIRCPDGHFRRAIYELAAYIADYPEQVLCTCIVQGWCPNNNDLDTPSLRRSRAMTNTLTKELDLGTLWDDYGIVGNLIPFTNDFPRADMF